MLPPCPASAGLNVSQLERDGYMVVDGVLPAATVDELRDRVLAARTSGWWSLTCKPSHGVTMPDFVARPQLAFLRQLLEEPAVLSALASVFRGQRFRFCGHSDVGVDRLVPWHKDRLNGAYAKYQQLPIWRGTEADAADLASPSGVGHKILKAAFYLQSHEADDAGLTVVPGSHLAPTIATAGACQLHPRKGAVVLFDQRITHRGVPAQSGPAKGRVLVTLGFGRDNAHTREFEAGTVARQQDQSRLIAQACGSCKGARHKNCTVVATPAAFTAASAAPTNDAASAGRNPGAAVHGSSVPRLPGRARRAAANTSHFSCHFLNSRIPPLLGSSDAPPRCTAELLAKTNSDFIGLKGGGLPYCLPEAERGRASLRAVLSAVRLRSLLQLKGRSCAVVGSSGWLRGSRLGESIDKHDVVIRMNGAPANGSRRFVEDVGERTSIRMFDIGAYATQFDWTDAHVAELRAAEHLLVWTSHPSGYDRVARNLLAMDEVPLEAAHPPAEPLQPALLPRIVGLPPSRVALLNPSVVALAHTVVGWSGRERLGRPTAGVVATLFALDFCASVDLYGFSWGSGDKRESAHYWRPIDEGGRFRPCSGPTRVCGALSSKSHDLRGEYALLHALRASKLVGWHPDAPGMPEPAVWRGCPLPLRSFKDAKLD